MATALTMTGLEYDALPYEEGRVLELLDGEIIRMPSPTLEHQEIVFRVQTALKAHLTPSGAIVSHDVEFALSRNTRLRPDVFAVLGERAAGINSSCVPIPGCPDLAVEVISPSEYASETMRKVASYLDQGTKEVWQFYPTTREVVIHAPQGQVRKCRGGEAVASWLLADFKVPVSQFIS